MTVECQLFGEEWKVKVTQELQPAWPTEAPAFQFADVNAAPCWGRCWSWY